MTEVYTVSIFPFILACTLLGCIFEPPRIKSRHARPYPVRRYMEEPTRNIKSFRA